MKRGRKKTENGWEYYQLQVRANATILACADCFISMDGKPLQQVLSLQPAYQKDERVQNQLQQIRQKLNTQAIAQFPALLQRIREDARKPRILDWRKDVWEYSELQPLIAEYRNTKSDKAAEAVYRAVASRYHLYARQDSLQVIKSVLDHGNIQ